MSRKKHVKTKTEELYIRSKTANAEFEVYWRRKQFRRWVGSCAILITLVTLIYNGTTTKSDAASGAIKKALLIMEGGASVSIDDQHDERIISPGNCIITNQDGHLTYLSCDPADGDTVIHTLSIPQGSSYALTLPDQTNIWMNAASTLDLEIVAGIIQSVTLSGEANFETSPALKGTQTALKLYIKDRNINIEAPAGTRFNVSAYADDPIIKTSLYEGDGIKISSNGRSTILAAARQAQLHGTGLSVVKLSDKASGAGKVWRGERFIFKGADFKSFMKQIGRLHDMEVEYKGEVPAIYLNAELDQDTDLLYVLDIFQKMGIRSTIKGRKIIIE